MSTNILYSCPAVAKDREATISSVIMQRYNVKLHGFQSTEALLSALVCKTVVADYVAIDCSEFNDFANNDVYSSITVVATLGKVNNPNVKIIAIVDKNVDKTLLKLMIGVKEIDYFAARHGDFTGEEVIASVDNYLTGGDRLPLLIKNILETKKKSSKKQIALTPRQEQILDIISTRGASNKVIAKMLTISESTVKLHVGAILKKYGVKNRTQLAVFSKSR